MTSEPSASAHFLRHHASGLHRELMARQPVLTGFAGVMLALMVPTLFLLVLDDRTWREVAIWAKPMKFIASTALFAATTAWFVGLLPERMRGSRAPGVRIDVASLWEDVWEDGASPTRGFAPRGLTRRPT